MAQKNKGITEWAGLLLLWSRLDGENFLSWLPAATGAWI